MSAPVENKGSKSLKKVLSLFSFWVAVGFVLGWISGPAGQAGGDGAFALAPQSDLESRKVAPFVPTPHMVVEKMLEMAEIKDGDVLYDLGSGDGRIVIAAAKKYGIRAVGFEIDPELVRESREKIREENLGHLAEIREQDIFTVDLSPATVVTMYLFPEVNLTLRPNLQKQLKPGSRVVSHGFGMGDWKPSRLEFIKDAPGWSRTIYLWRIGEDRSIPDFR